MRREVGPFAQIYNDSIGPFVFVIAKIGVRDGSGVQANVRFDVRPIDGITCFPFHFPLNKPCMFRGLYHLFYIRFVSRVLIRANPGACPVNAPLQLAPDYTMVHNCGNLPFRVILGRR